jgi:transcriptional regulator with XRE-family HTH domain
MARQKSPNPIDKHVGSLVRMRRMMLDMSQSTLGNALGITFQQVQKYEKGTNRISASRLQQVCHTLQVPVAFFFEGAPHVPAVTISNERQPSPDRFTDFMATREGLTLAKAFMRITNVQVRRRIVNLVEQIEEHQNTAGRGEKGGRYLD